MLSRARQTAFTECHVTVLTTVRSSVRFHSGDVNKVRTDASVKVFPVIDRSIDGWCLDERNGSLVHARRESDSGAILYLYIFFGQRGPLSTRHT